MQSLNADILMLVVAPAQKWKKSLLHQIFV